jgi:hypothetical protein
MAQPWQSVGESTAITDYRPLMQTCYLGAVSFCFLLGSSMRRAIFAIVLLAVGCFSLPIFAQQQDLSEVMDAANALSARESELLTKKDAAGIAALFTSDGLLVMLAPQFAFRTSPWLPKTSSGAIPLHSKRIPP